MAAPEPSTTAETASSPLAAQDNETIVASGVQDAGSGEGQAGEEVAREEKAEAGKGDVRPQFGEISEDGLSSKEAKVAEAETEGRPQEGSRAVKESDQASPISTEPAHNTSYADGSTSTVAPPKDEDGSESHAEDPRDTDAAPSADTLKPIPIHASTTINRTSSPAYSQSSVTSGQGKDSVASPSLGSTAPKKFSTVNINKKFLGKSGTAGSAPPGSAGLMGHKEGGLGLVNLSARPSPTLTQQQSASRILTSAKLTSVIPSKPSTATGGLSSAPVAGWAKPAVAASAKSTPSAVNGALSPRTGTPVSGGLKLAEGAATAAGTTLRGPSIQTGGHLATTTTAAPTGIRLTNQGPSATRHLTSLNTVKPPVKRGWQTVSPNPEQQDPSHRENNGSGAGAGGHGPFGQARFKQSLSNDFPTAMEVIEGQRSAVVQAAQAAQAKAAHNQAILEGLNAFRGTNKDPNAHGWDEEDDEDMDFPQVLDFGDGTTYTLPVSNAREQENNQPQAGEMQQIQEQPVSKAERFATDDFDRSWPPKAPHGFASQERRRSNDHQHSNDHLASTRTLYNARLNKMEPSHERPAPASAEPAPRTQILPRSTKDGTSGAPALATRSEKQPSQQPLERQISRERPWGRVQPPVIGAERNPWGKRRPSESEHGRTWGPPHAVGEGQAWPRADDQNARSPPGHQAPLAPLFSQTQSISAVLSPPPVAPAAISPAIDITELQKDEMHRAAEQARLRRQQEEAEREAQKERARKKAEEIAAREAQRAQSKSSVQQPRSETPHIRKQDEIALEKPRASVPRIDALHQPAIRNPPAIGTRRPSEKRVAFEDPVPVQATSRIESARRPPAGPGSSAVPATSGVRQEADVSRIANAFAGSPPSIVSPNNQHFSAFFDPLAESDHLPTTELHYNDLSSLSNEARTAESPEARKVAIPGAVDRFNLRPELLQAESWRKSTRGQEVIVPGVIGSSREQRAPQRILLQKPLPPPVPDTPQTMEELAWSPPDHVKVALPPQQAQSPLPDTNVGSAFDTVLARLQHAMSTPNEQHQYRPQGDSERESYTGIQAAEITDLSEAHMESEIRLSYTSLPRPQDFVLSTIPLPPSPGPAWKRYTIRLPRDPAIEKPYPARSQNSHLRAAVPPGWILSWDPPLEQLGPRNLSREDWLMPKSYHRGKLVTTVRLPSGSFQPYVRTQGDVRPGEASAITSQAIKDEAHKSGSKKIVVRLPTGNFPSRGGNGEASGAAETLSVREEFQTSSDIPSLSPVSSSEDLPSTAHADHHVNDAAAARKAARKVPEGVAIAFARPHGNSFSEDGDAKSSVRFMVSSEIEDDNLLSEVNKMSMDGLLDNPAAEESQGLGLETEPRAPSTPSAPSRVAAGTRSGPPSPSLATNSAWTSSGTYPVAQSPGRKMANRDHVMNVWTNVDGDRGTNQPHNALQQREGENSSGQLPSSQDASDDTGSGEQLATRNEIDLDLDLPRYASINTAPTKRESTEADADPSGQFPTSGRAFDDHSNSASVPQGYEGYQYMAINHMAPAPHLPSAYASRSPINGMNTNALGSMSSAQHGVWMPLHQAGNGPYSSGISAAGSPIYGAHSMSKSPVSSGYDGTPVMSSAGLSLGPMPSMGGSSGGMYSHPSGPLDSPAVPFIRPAGYTSQPSHLGGMPAMYNQAGPYATGGREMYGSAQQYGHRANMGQSMLSAGGQEYGGRFNNSMAVNRPFGGFNGASTGQLGGSRYNPGMNGFAQSNLQGSQQQRIGMSGQGKVGPNAGRKVW